MKMMQNDLFRMDRNDLKEFVRAIEEKAGRNGWVKGHPIEVGSHLTDEECRKYGAAKTLLCGTVDLDEGAVSGLGGSAALIRALDDARKASYVYGTDNDDVLEPRFSRLINSLALRLLVNIERKCVIPDTKKFVATIETHVARTEEIEAADEDEAKAKAEKLADEGEFVSRVEEAAE